MSTLHFYKLQGTGNDFVAWDNRTLRLPLDEIIALAPLLCDRKRGIGADGILILENSDSSDYEMIYRNADGSDAGMCGNGGRCMALLARKFEFAATQTFMVHDKKYRAEIRNGNLVSLFFPEVSSVEQAVTSAGISVLKTYTGTEHVVIADPAITTLGDNKLFETGRKIRQDSAFQPSGTNVNFLLECGQEALTIKTYERGVEDFTLACGTGAIASALAWHHLQKASDGPFTYRVDNPGGPLEVTFRYDEQNKSYSDLCLTGTADIVFEGEYPL